MRATARSYLQSGLSVLPALSCEKRPALPSWTQYQHRLPTERQAEVWFTEAQAICIVTGAISGHLEMLDFDHGAELFEPWRQLVSAAAPGLTDRLVIERSQSGGRHVIYRCETPVGGNRKLAQRTLETSDAQPLTVAGKEYVPRRVGDRYEVTYTLIETRGEGGVFLCAPSPGYELEQGSFSAIPILTEQERAVLIQAARALDENLPPLTPAPPQSLGTGRPGDDFNERGDVRESLRRHGWRLVRDGQNEYWCRPGKTAGVSATLRDGIFYVFSSNAAPFEPDRGYAPFSVYAMLDHDGDFAAAAAALRDEGFGQCVDAAVNLSAIMGGPCAPPTPTVQPEFPDPGPLPVELLRVPGFVSDVMDHSLATAPYPNVALAFCGALALQATLAGRKVCDEGDNRTNLYLLALAYSAVGKDWPRKVNTRILHDAGMVDVLGDRFASGEGIQDALFQSPTMLFQTDEIDGLLQSMNKSQDVRHEHILGTLLTMYSSANSIYPMRRKAGKEPPGVIDQPCLVVYGTAIPTHYYQAISERMLTNGFFARMIIVESGPRSAGQDPRTICPPPQVLEVARWWAAFQPGDGNLGHWHPQPRVVEADDDARDLLRAARETSETEYTLAEARNDPVGTTVWGRVPEHIRKLALLHAVSVNHASPRIDTATVRWATDFVLHQTRRMLFMAHSHVAANPFHAQCLKLLGRLRDAPDGQLAHSVLLKRMKVDARTFRELISTLEQQGDVVTRTHATDGRPQRIYQLAAGEHRSETGG